ncbi:hypothetical protein [Kitasatospora sp. NPDC059571]|uniref:hypothetical protein n=1 Tax=Kitasatospora sp. NPDC059571 TaxID=3346871 RepID=UPI003676FB4C
MAEVLRLEFERWRRVASVVVTFLLLGAVPALFAVQSSGPWGVRGPIAGVFLLLGPLVGVRAGGYAVRCGPDDLVVRGFLRTRRIPVEAVIAVRTDVVVWCDRRGRLRRTVLWGLRESHGRGPDLGLDARKRALREELGRWAHRTVRKGLDRRIRAVGELDDDALRREVMIARAGGQGGWEYLRRRAEAELIARGPALPADGGQG